MSSSLLLKFIIFAFSISSMESSWANYSKAQKMFKAGNYYGAAPEFYSSYRLPRNKSEYLKSEWGLAESLRKVGLFYSASKYYSIIVRRGRSPKNPFFRMALEKLGKVNRQVNLGGAHIKQLFASNVRASDVPGNARGFYFYYKGIEAFNNVDPKLEKARDYFRKVPQSSNYHIGALFHLAVINNLSGKHSRAIEQFRDVIQEVQGSKKDRELYESALINIARVHYETKKFPKAIEFYGQIPRDSHYWLDAIWETAWAFFFIQKYNNALGQIHTIHSPFFDDRFYPETYILQAITFLRLCRYDRVKESMRLFKKRYKKTFKNLKGFLKEYRRRPQKLYKFISRYESSRRLNRYQHAEEVIQKLTRTDAFQETKDILRFSQREIESLSDYKGRWRTTGLVADARSFLKAKKGTAVRGAGRQLYKSALFYYGELVKLSQQTNLIVAEMQLGKLARLRSKISTYKDKNRIEFIGGMQRLSIGESLEYWPFEQEYWEDELGFYVYNMASQCKSKK